MKKEAAESVKRGTVRDLEGPPDHLQLLQQVGALGARATLVHHMPNQYRTLTRHFGLPNERKGLWKGLSQRCL